MTEELAHEHGQECRCHDGGYTYGSIREWDFEGEEE